MLLVLGTKAALIVPTTAFAQREAELPLSLQDAMRRAAASNLGLLARRQERDEKLLGATSAGAAYAPVLRIDVDTDDTGDGRLLSGSYNAALEWHSPVGTTVAVSAGLTDRAGSGASTDAAQARLLVAQSLLRGSGESGAASELARARLEAERQRALFRQRLDEFLVQVSDAYWELAYQQLNVTNTRRSRDRAIAQFEDTQENIRRGILAATEIHIVEENVVRFEQSLLRAEEQLTLAQSSLVRLLQLDPAVAPVAADGLDCRELDTPGLAATTALAIGSNPQLVAERLGLEQAELLTAYHRNRVLPELDLSASITLNSLATGHGAAWSNLGQPDGLDVRVGLSLEIPLWMAPELAALESSRIRARRRLTELKDAESRLVAQVRDRLTRLEAQSKTEALARRLVDLGERKLTAEQEKYRAGMTTLTDLVRCQRDLDEAEQAHRRQQSILWRSHARLLSHLGRLHQTAGVKVR